MKKMKRKYGVVLVGCGHIGEQHIRDIYFREQIHIVGVVDIDPKRAQEFRVKYGAESCGTDYREYLQRSEVDIVIIATYVSTHLAILRDCLQNGKHVLCEKPIGRTEEEGREFIRLVRSSPCRVLVGHILRYNETYRRAAELIHSGAIGRLTLIRMVQNHHSKNWPRYRRLLEDCSPIVDCGVHYIDVMQWFTGEKVINVDGFGGKIDDDLPEAVYNYGVINVRFPSGCIGYYEAGWSQNLSSCNVKEFVGSSGRLTITLNANRAQDVEEGDLIRLYRNDTNEYTTINCPSKYKNMWAQMQRLIAMIENGEPAVPSIDEIESAFCIAMRADEAIRKKGI